jgi:hypothetical protein
MVPFLFSLSAGEYSLGVSERQKRFFNQDIEMNGTLKSKKHIHVSASAWQG